VRSDTRARSHVQVSSPAVRPTVVVKPSRQLISAACPKSPPEYSQLGAMTARRTQARYIRSHAATRPPPRRWPPATRVSRSTRHAARD